MHGATLMDPLWLLQRSARPLQRRSARPAAHVPSQGAAVAKQTPHSVPRMTNGNLKRKRGSEEPEPHQTDDVIDFFAQASNGSKPSSAVEDDRTDLAVVDEVTDNEARAGMSLEDRKRILKEHKLKITLLAQVSKPAAEQVKAKKKKKKSKRNEGKSSKDKVDHIYPEPVLDLRELRRRYGISKKLLSNIIGQGFKDATEVQMAALPLQLGELESAQVSQDLQTANANLLSIAPTGSGKTVAFLIPLLHALQRCADTSQRKPKAIILAPTKELVQQIAHEGELLAKGLGILIEAFRKGRHISPADTATSAGVEARSPDVLVATPVSLALALEQFKPSTETPDSSLSPLASVKHLILDEADVLLDPLFRAQTTAVWKSCPHTDLRVSLWSATIASSVEDSIKSTIAAHHASHDQGSTVAPQPLVRLVVGLKDSAVPNITHRLTYCATEAGKLLALRELLNPRSASTPSGPSASATAEQPLRAPFLVFTQTIARCTALHAELKYDIPLAAGGSSRIAALHSDLPDHVRAGLLALFRRGEIWVLITTDLLARGVDFRGVNGVVNYDVPTSSAGYVHRVGRTGRQGRSGGVAVTLYTSEDVGCVKVVANVIAAAQRARGGGPEGGKGGVEQWLLDALPDVSKEERKRLKRRGVEERRGGGAGAGSRISSKSGYVRREENRKKGYRDAARRGPGAGGSGSGSNGLELGRRSVAAKAAQHDKTVDDFDGFSD